MKKIISLILAVSVCFLSLTACGNSSDNVSGGNSITDNIESEAIESQPTESQESQQEPTSKPAPQNSKPSEVIVGPYTVYDAQNTRGLSTKKSGFGFGVAENGQPHSISVNNQARFDAMANVNALALDTKCIDKRMYLTFDCGWEYNNLTADILDTLKEKQVKAAFFLTLDYVKKNPALTRRMIDEGHIVGNHSAHHPSFPTISREKMAKEIWELEDYIKKNFNYESKYFRFPSGENSECSLELVSSIGYSSIFWSVAYGDWDVNKQPTTEVAVKTVTDRYHNGAVILLHAVSTANADGLSQMIDIAHTQGYQFKTLDEYNK